MLTLHQLQVFVVVVDEMSVSRAAERLVVSQPAVSATLASLRKEVGVDLLERSGRGIALTDAGRTMYKYAQQVTGLIDEAVESVRETHRPDRRPVRIATSSSLVSAVVAPILARLREHQPDLAFSLAVGNRNEVWRLLASREADVALTSKPPAIQDFETLATMPNSCVVAARPGTVFSGHLDHVPWLVRETGATLRSVAEEILTGLDLQPDLIEIGSDDALLGSLEAGLGIGVLPRDAIDAAIRSRRLVIVPTAMTPMERPWHLIVRRGEQLDDHIAEFTVDLVLADARFSWAGSGI